MTGHSTVHFFYINRKGNITTPNFRRSERGIYQWLIDSFQKGSAMQKPFPWHGFSISPIHLRYLWWRHWEVVFQPERAYAHKWYPRDGQGEVNWACRHSSTKLWELMRRLDLTVGSYNSRVNAEWVHISIAYRRQVSTTLFMTAVTPVSHWVIDIIAFVNESIPCVLELIILPYMLQSY